MEMLSFQEIAVMQYTSHKSYDIKIIEVTGYLKEVTSKALFLIFVCKKKKKKPSSH